MSILTSDEMRLGQQTLFPHCETDGAVIVKQLDFTETEVTHDQT